MSSQKLQGYVGIEVYKSDDANIPVPAEATSGTTTSAPTSSDLVQTGQTFESTVKAGDIVYNTTDGTAATVIQVVSDTELKLNAGIMATGEDYVVYQASKQGNGHNAGNGCVLYLGGTDGNLRVTTIGGQVLNFIGLKGGDFFPVQVKKVHATGTTLSNIIALW
ncbi:MAG: hypothetical protein GY920_19295 [Aliivibrio sp.]|nr:hypothetical protein [Aliivibrio sp.]